MAPADVALPSIVPAALPSTFYPSTEYPAASVQPHPVPPPHFGVMCGNPPAPAVFAGYSTLAASGAATTAISYEKELQEFIKQTPLDGEYEKKMELFLLRVGKGAKEGKEKEEKDKKKKKKKDRSKDKKKRKDSKRDKSKKEKHKKKKKLSEDDDSEKPASPNLNNLGEFEELEAKLSAVYSKLTKEPSKKKKKLSEDDDSDKPAS